MPNANTFKEMKEIPVILSWSDWTKVSVALLLQRAEDYSTIATSVADQVTTYAALGGKNA